MYIFKNIKIGINFRILGAIKGGVASVLTRGAGSPASSDNAAYAG